MSNQKDVCKVCNVLLSVATPNNFQNVSTLNHCGQIAIPDLVSFHAVMSEHRMACRTARLALISSEYTHIHIHRIHSYTLITPLHKHTVRNYTDQPFSSMDPPQT